MNKFIKLVATVCVLLSVFILPCSALSFSSTYSDVVQSSTQSNNLIALAMNYDSFIRSEYVVFCPNQNQYYIVWGDLTASSDRVTSSGAIEYISYIRSGTTTNYVYDYGSSSSFALNSSNVCTSNIEHFGMKSTLYDDFFSNHISLQFYIFGLAILIVILLFKIRKG